MITIIDSGGANLSSIQFSLNRLGVSAQLSCNADVIKNSSHVILPGVASANTVMNYLKERNLIDVIRSLTQPVLGICLGMQLLFEFSEEGNVPCMKIIPGKVKKISTNKFIPRTQRYRRRRPGYDQLIVPHTGWNKLTILKNNSLMKNIVNDAYVYFVHSYAVPFGEYTIANTNYGDDFSAVVQFKNYFGVQFHPERSGPVGSLILKNFLEL